MYKYRATITEVYDGDTVTAEIDLGFNIKFTEKLRLYGINAPELRGETKSDGEKSRDYLRAMILGKVVEIETIKDKKEKYGRYLAKIWLSETTEENKFVSNTQKIFINESMVFKGFAKEYLL